jgi:hypothetical protein
MLELKSELKQTLRHYPGTREERRVSHLSEDQAETM